MCIVSSRKYRLALTYCFGGSYAKDISIKSSIQLADGLRLPVRKVKLNLRRRDPEIVAGQRTGADFSWVASLQHSDTLETMTFSDSSLCDDALRCGSSSSPQTKVQSSYPKYCPVQNYQQGTGLTVVSKLLTEDVDVI